MSMEHHPYYEGDKLVDKFSFSTSKEIVAVEVIERWEQISFVSVSCGNSEKRIINKTYGINKTEFEKFERIIKSALRFPDIFSFEYEVRKIKEFTITTKLEITNSVEHTFNSDSCTRRTQVLHQKVREYNFFVHVFLSPPESKSHFQLKERLDVYYDQILKVEIEPNCNCDAALALPSSVKVFGNLGNVSVSYSIPIKASYIYLWNKKIDLNSITNVEKHLYEFQKEDIPAYLLSLCGLESDRLYFLINLVISDSYILTIGEELKLLEMGKVITEFTDDQKNTILKIIPEIFKFTRENDTEQSSISES